MSVTITDHTTGKVRTSLNLRGLYDHARRVAQRRDEPLFMSVSVVEVTKAPDGGALVTVEYQDGDEGHAKFASYSIARQWAQTFADKRGGELKDNS